MTDTERCIAIGGAMKAIGDNGLIEGYAVAFTSPDERDLHGQYFTQKTNFHREMDEIVGIPILYHHGLDGRIKRRILGYVTKSSMDERGVWIQAQLDMHKDYVQDVHELAKRGVLSFSSGADAPYVSASNDGHLDDWPFIEFSETPTPAEPNKTVISAKTYTEMIKDAIGHEDHKAAVKADLQDRQSEMTKDDSMPEEMMAILKQILAAVSKDNAMDEAEQNAALSAMQDPALSEDEQKALSDPEIDEKKSLDITKRLMQKAIDAVNAKRTSRTSMISNASKGMTVNGTQFSPSRTAHIGAVTDEGENEPIHTKRINVNKGAVDTPWLSAMNNSLVGRGRGALPNMKAVKAQNPYIGPLGGDLVGQELATQILEPLRPKVVAFNAGVKQTTVSGIGSYTVPRMTTAPTAFRPGINTAITASNAGFDAVTAFLRPIAAQVDIPRQLLATTPLNAEAMIRDQMIKSIRLLIDYEIFLGIGTVTGSNTGASIRGVLNTLEGDADLSATNVVTLATDGRQANYSDLVNAETQLYNGNVEQSETWAWVMNPTIRGSFRSLTDTTGQPIILDGFQKREFDDPLGYRLWTSTQIPRTVTTGANTDTSYVFLGDWQYGEYVMGNDIEIIVDEVSQASSLMIRITAFTFSDFIVHYPQAFYAMKGVRR